MKYRRVKGGKTVAKMAKGKVTSIQALAKAVKGLQRKNRSEADYINLRQIATNQNIGGAVATPYQLNLCNYVNMGFCFGTALSDTEDNRMVHKSFGIDGYVSLENSVNDEENTVGFSMYLVSLKDAATQIFSPATGTLVLTDGVTHSDNGKGMTLLNKKFFKIHKSKRFFLSNHGTALAQPSAQTQYGTDHRFYMKWSPNSLITNPSGNWQALASALDPSKQYYLLIFNDNTTADLESPCISYSIVHTVKTLG